MPKVTPPPGQTVEEVTRTRILPAADSEPEKFSTDALEYMDALSADKWNAGNHLVYIYRVDPPVFRGAPGPTYVTKFSTPITLEQIQSEYGGGMWRILVKRGVERAADRVYPVAGSPRDLTRSQQEFRPELPGGVPPDGPNNLASQAMNLAANPGAQAAQVRLLETAASNAIEMVKQTAPQQLSVKDIIELARSLAPQQPVEKPFLETPLGALAIAAATTLVNRLITPVDPLAQLSQMAEVMSKFGGGSSSSDWKTALVNAAPQLANAVRDTVQELRLGTEAQMRMNAGRTLQAAQPAVPALPNPAQPENVVQMPAPAAQTGPPAMEPFESRLVELLNDPNMTGDKAGEILDATWPTIVDEVSRYTVDQIMMAFRSRPLLAPHANNPRLREFLTQFLAWANEPEAPPTA